MNGPDSPAIWMKEWNPGVDRIPDSFFGLAVYDEWPNQHIEDERQVRLAFSAHNPFFQDGKAWLGVVPGKARLCGFWKPDLTWAGKKAAYFGYWESVDERAANEILFAELKDWAKKLGAETIVGPINFSTFGQYRIRLEAKPSDDILLGEPLNPPYFADLLKGLGFVSCARYETAILPLDRAMKQHYLQKMQDLRHAAYSDFRFLKLDKETWLGRLPEIHQVTMDFFADAAGFKPVSFEAFRSMYGSTLAERHCPHSTLLLEDAQGRIISYVLAVPNYGSVMRRGPGNPGLEASELSFETCFPLLRDKQLVIKTIGVHPRYRGRGLMNIAVGESILRAAENGYTSVAYALYRDDNLSARSYPDLPRETRRYEVLSFDLGGA